MTRDEWSQNQTDCWVCGWSRYDPRQPEKWRLETHEITRGVHRQAGLVAPATWMRACNVCHDEMGDASIWPIARQLALKKLRDPTYYDRVEVNRLRHRADNAIEEVEVDAYREDLRG